MGRFQPGQSGNPGGRPKLEGEVRDLARAFTVEAIEKLGELMRSKDPRVAIRAAEALLDRGWGRPRQAVELSGEVAAPDLEGAREKLAERLARISTEDLRTMDAIMAKAEEPEPGAEH